MSHPYLIIFLLFRLKLLEAGLRGIFDPVYIFLTLANPRSRAAGNAQAGFKTNIEKATENDINPLFLNL